MAISCLMPPERASLTGKTGSVADTDLVSAGNNKSAVFTAYLLGTAVVRVTIGTMPNTPSGVLTVLSNDATLSGLTISQGTLSPSFATNTTAYTDSVANNVTSATVTPTANQTNAAVKVNGTTVSSGSPSSAISLNVGSNTITILVTAQDGVTTKTYTITVMVAAAGGGGESGGGGVGGGGGPTPVTSGVTDVAIYVNSQGVFTQMISCWSDDYNTVVTIPSGTTGLTSSGAILTQISILHLTTPPAFQTGAGIIGLAYDVTPNGLTFSPGVTLEFGFNPGLVPAGVDPTSLQIAYYDTNLNAWVTLPSTVNTDHNYVLAQISHFTVYAVTYGVKPVTAVPTTTPTTTATPTTTLPIWTSTTTTTTTAAVITTTTTSTQVETTLPITQSPLTILSSTISPNVAAITDAASSTSTTPISTGFTGTTPSSSGSIGHSWWLWVALGGLVLGGIITIVTVLSRKKDNK